MTTKWSWCLFCVCVHFVLVTSLVIGGVRNDAGANIPKTEPVGSIRDKTKIEAATAKAYSSWTISGSTPYWSQYTSLSTSTLKANQQENVTPGFEYVTPDTDVASSSSQTTSDRNGTNSGSPSLDTSDWNGTNSGSPFLETSDGNGTNSGSPSLESSDGNVTHSGSPSLESSDGNGTNSGSPLLESSDGNVTNSGSRVVSLSGPSSVSTPASNIDFPDSASSVPNIPGVLVLLVLCLSLLWPLTFEL